MNLAESAEMVGYLDKWSNRKISVGEHIPLPDAGCTF